MFSSQIVDQLLSSIGHMSEDIVMKQNDPFSQCAIFECLGHFPAIPFLVQYFTDLMINFKPLALRKRITTYRIFNRMKQFKYSPTIVNTANDSVTTSVTCQHRVVYSVHSQNTTGMQLQNGTYFKNTPCTI